MFKFKDMAHGYKTYTIKSGILKGLTIVFSPTYNKYYIHLDDHRYVSAKHYLSCVALAHKVYTNLWLS